MNLEFKNNYYICILFSKSYIMKNKIIDKFYTKTEKFGFKTHTPSDEEIEYLQSLLPYMQTNILNLETNYIIRRLYFKKALSHVIIIISLILSIIFYTQAIAYIVILFTVLGLVSFILYRHYSRYIRIRNIVKHFDNEF